MEIKTGPKDMGLMSGPPYLSEKKDERSHRVPPRVIPVTPVAFFYLTTKALVEGKIVNTR